MKRCPIAAKIAGLIGILPHCVLNDFFICRGIFQLVAKMCHHTDFVADL